MVNKWNKEQLDAIFSRNANILVSAGAGSGKTAVLVQRIIEMICNKEDPIDINRLLVVTFTKKAAAEMKERITEELINRIQNDPDDNNLRRQFNLISRAKISTIHSFCLDIIRNNFNLAGLDPDFKIIDENLNKLLWQKAMEVTKEMMFSDDDLSSLFEYYGFGRNGEIIDEIISSMFYAYSTEPFPEKWIETSINMLSTDMIEDLPYIETILEISSIIIKGVISEIQNILLILETENSLERYIEIFEKAKDGLISVLSAFDKGFEHVHSTLSRFSFENLKRVSGDVNVEMKEYIKSVKAELSGRIRKLEKDYYSLTAEEIIVQNNGYAEIYIKIVKLFRIFIKNFNELKKIYNSIDYNDMERICLDLLIEEKDGEMIQSNTAKEIMSSIDEIFIDEYQDSNMMQDYILFSVSKCNNGVNNVFMVGDVKQSIYRFRLAMPEIFIKKYKEYEIEKESKKRKINLQANYRSRKEIIDYINELFSDIMTKNVGEIEYNIAQELVLSRDYPQLPDINNVEILLYDRKEELEGEFSEYENVQKEALVIKDKIVDIISNKKITDNNGNLKDTEYRDIVILTRANKNFSSSVRDILLNYSIPVFSEGETGYFDQLEIRLAIAFFNIIDNSLQDIDIIAVMRSFIGGFSLDEIARIKMIDRNAAIYNNLVSASKYDKKSEELITLINKLKNIKNSYRIHEFIIKVFNETFFIEYFRALPSGELRAANLRLLVSRARDYDENINGSLFSFLNYISDISKRDITPESAKTVAENENVVRIMSIHSSKGLQFPCVILANTGKYFNRSDERGKLLVHKGLGVGPEIIDKKRKIRYDSLPKKAITGKIMLENMSEEMRVLYVALTRAMERLYITGGKANINEYIKNLEFRQIGSEYSILFSNSFLEWILKGTKNSSHIKVVEIKDIINEGQDVDEEEIFSYEREEISPEILEKITWEYPFSDISKYPAKITVTELKKFKYNLLADDHIDSKESFDIKNVKPSFIDDVDMLDPKERGTLYHYIMQLLDFKKINDIDDVAEMLLLFKNNDYISAKEYESVDPDLIFAFFKTDIGAMCRKAEKLYKETAFNVALKDFDLGDDKPVLQGVIDLFFEHDGDLILVDYKTDFVRSSEEHLLTERYMDQIEHYSYALSVITGKKVREKYIYSFFLSKEILF